jgi:hypothetical protein
MARYRDEVLATDFSSFLAMLLGSLLLDATVRPRRTGIWRWRWRGLLVHALSMIALFGLILFGSGSVPVAAVLAIAVVAVFTAVSNAKHAMLGEPLLFSDLALVAAIVRHPRFYFTAISTWQCWMLGVGGAGLLLALGALFVSELVPHLWGLCLFGLALAALALLFASGAFASMARTPDVDADLIRNGLIATLLLYALRWRATLDPPQCPPALFAVPTGAAASGPGTPELIVIVQCESFADPVELTGNPAYALPGLTRARAAAWQCGNLGVSGFGAYTMRTEYGVLFGRSEADLGFRRYDPFLTAGGETSYALPARVRGGGYGCLFVHPHDMRFYGRDRLMPAMGFDRLIGEDSFAQVSRRGGRYVDDRTLGAAMGKLIDGADGPMLIYAVTMENHGPWDKDDLTGEPGGLGAYLRHVASSDSMLSDLIDRLSSAGRSGLLVFFGDHRPSIPGVTEPGGARHTPYVMLRFSVDGQIERGFGPQIDLTPDQLHHAILRCIVPNGDPAPREVATADRHEA